MKRLNQQVQEVAGTAVGTVGAAVRIEAAPAIPPRGKRDELSRGQAHQLRDAMLFSSHVEHGGALLITGDAKAFISDGS